MTELKAEEYTQWRNFSKVIERARIACENSGHDVFYDFAEVSKIVEAGATNKSIKDYELSRYACYLVVQNGDLRKEDDCLTQSCYALSMGVRKEGEGSALFGKEGREKDNSKKKSLYSSAQPSADF